MLLRRRQARNRFENMGIGNRETIGPFIGWLAGQAEPGQHAEAVEVGARIDIAAAGLLGAHVVAGADREPGAGDTGRLTERTGDPEVGQQGRVIEVEQDIPGSHVAMHITAVVSVAERVGDAFEHADQVLFG